MPRAADGPLLGAPKRGRHGTCSKGGLEAPSVRQGPVALRERGRLAALVPSVVQQARRRAGWREPDRPTAARRGSSCGAWWWRARSGWWPWARRCSPRRCLWTRSPLGTARSLSCALAGAPQLDPASTSLAPTEGQHAEVYPHGLGLPPPTARRGQAWAWLAYPLRGLRFARFQTRPRSSRPTPPRGPPTCTGRSRRPGPRSWRRGSRPPSHPTPSGTTPAQTTPVGSRCSRRWPGSWPARPPPPRSCADQGPHAGHHRPSVAGPLAPHARPAGGPPPTAPTAPTPGRASPRSRSRPAARRVRGWTRPRTPPA